MDTPRSPDGDGYGGVHSTTPRVAGDGRPAVHVRILGVVVVVATVVVLRIGLHPFYFLRW